MDTKTDTLAARLTAARTDERKRALIMAPRPTPTARMRMRRAMDRVERLTLQAVLEAQEARRAALVAELAGAPDSDLVAALHAMKAEGKR
jgi:hypothetical protein